jgi:DNA-directed RNA polymerase specialized sigma24 family protein
MPYEDVSDDELVFLVRQHNLEAERILLERMRPKQERMIFRLLKDNRYSGLEPGDLKTIAIQSLYHAIDSYDGRKAVFDAFYHLLLERDLVNEIKKFNTFNQTLLNTALSFDEPLNEGGTLYDVIGQSDEKIGTVNPNHILELAEDVHSGLTPLEKAVLAYRMLGYSYSEIGRIFKKSYRQISRIVERIDQSHAGKFQE